MSDKEESYIDAASRLWDDAKKEHPTATTAASFLPVVGQATSALEFNDAWNHGDKTGMALAAAGMVPAGKLAIKGGKAIKAGAAAKSAAQAAGDAVAEKAAQATINKGAAKAAIGAGTAGANTAANLGANAKVERFPDAGNGSGNDDYAEEWNK